jgi:hypothetical protein
VNTGRRLMDYVITFVGGAAFGFMAFGILMGALPSIPPIDKKKDK